MLKNKPLTSIIMVAYDVSQLSRQITLLALEAICKYTNEEDYELILVDTIPEGAEDLKFYDTHNIFQMGQREDRIWIQQYLKDMKNPGTYASYNRGASVAKGDYLCFMQNDVFVTEGWLNNMKYYLDCGRWDVVWPDQGPKNREYVFKAQESDYEEDFTHKANREAGMMMIKKETFERAGKWPEEIIMFYGEKQFYKQLEDIGAKYRVTNKTMILHVNSGTYFARKEIDKDNLDRNVASSMEALARIEGRL